MAHITDLSDHRVVKMDPVIILQTLFSSHCHMSYLCIVVFVHFVDVYNKHVVIYYYNVWVHVSCGT